MTVSFEPKRTAVLNLDLLAGVTAAYLKDDGAMLIRAQGILNRARSAGMLVVHVRVAFRPGCPEISDRNMLLARVKASVPHQKLFEGAAGAFHPAVAPQGEDIVVTKNRVSAFAGPDLDLILRANNISTLVLFDVATSGVVLSTLLEASDKDYQVVVIGDCCTDLDNETHACLVKRLFPQRAVVLAADEFTKVKNETMP
jgi:nicotinamidase-related amidase